MMVEIAPRPAAEQMMMMMMNRTDATAHCVAAEHPTDSQTDVTTKKWSTLVKRQAPNSICF
eukprot:scaffold52073_cov51-Attheya_sp.AAC.2